MTTVASTQTAPSTSAPDTLSLAADIVSAYVQNNVIPHADLPNLLKTMHSTLTGLVNGTVTETQPAAPPQEPAVSVRKSISPEFIICLEDGKKFKSLKRHLRTAYDMSPEQYRQKWNLPHDYPMVAPAYAAARSVLAKQSGLGQPRAAEAAAKPAAEPKGRGRKAAQPAAH